MSDVDILTEEEITEIEARGLDCFECFPEYNNLSQERLVATIRYLQRELEAAVSTYTDTQLPTVSQE